MGILRELRDAVPLAEALASATLDAAEGLRQASEAASTFLLPKSASAATPTSGGGVSSSGEGGGGGGTLAATSPLVRAVDRSLQPRTVDWLNAHCERTTFKIPNPRNRNAAAENDMVTVGGWDCFEELHVVSDFYDPADMAKLTGGDRRSSSRRSGGSGNTGIDPRLVPAEHTRVFAGGDGIVGGSTSAPAANRPSGPVPVSDPAMAEQTKLLREIRDQGRQDSGLSRRVGGRP